MPPVASSGPRTQSTTWIDVLHSGREALFGAPVTSTALSYGSRSRLFGIKVDPPTLRGEKKEGMYSAAS